MKKHTFAFTYAVIHYPQYHGEIDDNQTKSPKQNNEIRLMLHIPDGDLPLLQRITLFQNFMIKVEMYLQYVQNIPCQ